MKTMKVLAVINPATDTGNLDKIAEANKDIELNYLKDSEHVVEEMHQQRYDLLILDKALPETEYRKLIRLSDLLHPDAAQIEFSFKDEEFIRFKMSGLMAKWMDAQSDGDFRYFDHLGGY
jgi:DNA-binding NarL/FixJ family response regulator